MVKRGLSLEEKKEKMKGILETAKEPFTLKQLEKAGTKAGVTQMAIKGVMEELVADSLVEMDKIGSTNWFWSFPSRQVAELQGKVSKLEEEVKASEAEAKALQQEKAALLKEREPTPARMEKLGELRKLRAMQAAKTAELAELKENDPNKAVEVAKRVELCKEAATRWTDNTWVRFSFGWLDWTFNSAIFDD